MFKKIGFAGLTLAFAAIGVAASAQQEVNIYSARHYQTDEALYTNFTKATGIQINRIEETDDKLLDRLKAEGPNSPADILIVVDAGRLWRAEQAGLLQPVKSKVLEERIPANLRHPDGQWFGFSTRARAIFYNKDLVKAGEIKTYEDLADPKWKGKICIRSSSNMYNLSLMSALIDRLGEEKAEAWAKGVVANFARDPKGGDSDQLLAASTGECAIALSNHYYYMRMVKSEKAEERAAAAKLQIVWPNQDANGTHTNISGAGLLKNAPHKENAIKFLEYLASDAAQSYFANGNNEFPVVAKALNNPELKALGTYKVDPVNVAVYGKNQPAAQKLYDRAGWK